MQVIAFIDNDLKLVESIKERNLQSLGRLYDIYGAALFGVICRIVPGVEQAEKTLITLFIKVWNQAGDFFARDTSLFNWLLTLTRETAFDARKSEGQPNPTDNNSVHIENKKIANETLMTDPTQRLTAFHLIYYKGLSLAEAAATVGKSIAELRVEMINTIKNLQDKK